MRIACPHCQATYLLADISPGTILVCHRCHTEFAADPIESEESATSPACEDQLYLFGQPDSNPATSTPSEDESRAGASRTGEPDRETTAAAEAPTEAAAQAAEASEAPSRRNVNIWPWLVATLLLVSVSGFLVQKDAWLDNPWLRSTLINLGLPVDVRNKDWLVQPDSVQAQWLKRNDGSRVLVIEGRLVNQLSCELPLPKLVIDFYADDAPDEIVKTELVTIALPPDMKTIRHAPYRSPAVDDVPVAARQGRGFMVVLDSLPPRIADFTLGVQAAQP